VLDGLRAHRAAAEAHEVAIMQTAVEWAALHPAGSRDDAATVPGTEGEVALAGPGAPLVAEFACAELASALGVPSEWGARLMGDALELCHRLPGVWARARTGELPVWRARRIAQATRGLSLLAAAWVDAQVAPFAHKVGPAQTDRLVDAAVARFDPEAAEVRRRAASDRRCLVVDHRQVSFDGTSRVYGELDLADALDLDAAVSAGAAELARLGSTESLDVRRAVAVGDLARRQPVLDLTSSGSGHEAPERRPVRRSVVVHVHLSQAAVSGADPVARVESAAGVRLVTAEQVRQWCGRSDAKVSVLPVLDLADHSSVDAYEIPDRLDQRVALREPTCVFPWCSRPARRCDIDHVLAHGEGGPTCDCNLAPLCRFHHRLKTHGRWVYTRLDQATLLWRSPHGLTFLRDHAGTRDLTRPSSGVPPPDR